MFTTDEISKDTAKRVLINGHSLFCKQPTAIDLDIDEIQNDVFKIAGCYRLASP